MDINIKEEEGFQYVEQGKGPVLLLLHGLFGALSNWKSALDHFSKNYRVVIPIIPIYGLPVLKTNLKGMTKFVHDFVCYKNLNEVTLLGNSLGGHIALIYALNHQERVKTMVLTGSSGLYESAMGDSFPKRNNYDFIKSKVEYTFYSPKTATKELVDEVFGIVNDRNKAMRIIMMAKSAVRQNLAKEIHKIKVPVCLIWGKQDRVTPPHVAEEFLERLPNAELHFMDECGHAPMMEKSEEFNAILDPFLAKHLLNQTQD